MTALSKNKQLIADKFSQVLAGLDEKSEGDKMIMEGMFKFFQGCIRSAELNATTAAEVVGSDEPSFDDEPGGEVSDEPSFDSSDETGSDEPSFDDEPAAAEPPKAARRPAAAAPAPAADDPYGPMKVQEIIDVLKNAGVDKDKIQAAYKAEKKDGVVKLAKKIDKLSEAWVKFFGNGDPVKIEAYAKKQGVSFKYPPGRSNPEKKRGVIADAFAARMMPVPTKK